LPQFRNPASDTFGAFPSVTILEAATKKTNDSKSLPEHAACIRKMIAEIQSKAPFKASLEVPVMDATSTARVEIKRIRPVW
jgi:hypothetical protein